MNLEELHERTATQPGRRPQDGNAPCWCGSGKKFRKCHEPRESMKRVGLREMIDIQRRMSKLKTCLHFDAPGGCDGGIIKAHSVQRQQALATIAENGHVLEFDGTRTKDGGPVSIGYRLASTFTGFCAKHDNALFKPIDDMPLDPSSRQHVALLTYRTLCNELFKKQRVSRKMALLSEADRGLSYERQRALHLRIEDVTRGTRAAIRDMTGLKGAVEQAIQAGDFSRVRAFVVEFNAAPDIACAGATQPEIDFLGNRLQNLAKVPFPAAFVVCSVLATARGGVAILSWFDPADPSVALARSLDALADDQIPNALVRFLFESFENMFFRPSWWGALKAEDRAALVKRFWNMGLNADYSDGRLLDDGRQYVNWQVTSRTWVSSP